MKKLLVSRSVSRSTLERTLFRALLFLRGVGSSPTIRRALEAGGYSDADHEQGWALLRAACGSVGAAPDPADAQSRHANAAVEAWIGPALQRAHAALARFYPEIEKAMFAQLDESRTGGLRAAAFFLQRLAALSNGNAEEREAAAILERRGFTSSERERIAALVVTATQITLPATVNGENGAPTTDDQLRLHAWLTDWTETANALIERRADLIRLGISRRKAKASRVNPTSSYAFAPIGADEASRSRPA